MKRDFEEMFQESSWTEAEIKTMRWEKMSGFDLDFPKEKNKENQSA